MVPKFHNRICVLKRVENCGSKERWHDLLIEQVNGEPYLHKKSKGSYCESIIFQVAATS